MFSSLAFYSDSDPVSDPVASENVYVIACMEGEKLLIFWSDFFDLISDLLIFW